MYTIGQMSQLCHISARRLRYYEAMGLLKPAAAGENGYRYYTADQLERIAAIDRLQGYGLTLAEIGQFLRADRWQQAQLLRVQREKNEQSLEHLRQSIALMTMDIGKLEGTMTTKEQSQVITMMLSEQRVFGLKRRIAPQEIHELFAELYAEAAKRGLTRTGVAQLVYSDQDYDPEQMEVEAQIPVAGSADGVKLTAAQLCAATIYQGPYAQIGTAYETIGKWLSQHPEYEAAGPVIERFLKDEHEVQSESELETGLLFPIKQR